MPTQPTSQTTGHEYPTFPNMTHTQRLCAAIGILQLHLSNADGGHNMLERFGGSWEPYAPLGLVEQLLCSMLAELDPSVLS